MTSLITPKDAAEQLGVGVHQVYQWCRRAHDPLPNVTIGKSGRFHRIIASEIDGWLARQTQGAVR